MYRRHKVLRHGSGGAHENLADVVLNSSRTAPASDLTADLEAVRNDREADLQNHRTHKNKK